MPKRMVMPILNEFSSVNSSKSECPSGTASRAPKSGKTSQAKRPWTSQKLSQDQLFTLLIGT